MAQKGAVKIVIRLGGPLCRALVGRAPLQKTTAWHLYSQKRGERAPRPRPVAHASVAPMYEGRSPSRTPTPFGRRAQQPCHVPNGVTGGLVRGNSGPHKEDPPGFQTSVWSYWDRFQALLSGRLDVCGMS